LIDIDGTVVKHNGYRNNGEELLPGVKEFWDRIPPNDVIVLLSARTTSARPATVEFLRRHGLRFDHALFDLPTGERVLINDNKPGGLATALSINIPRDEGMFQLGLYFDDKR
jgi:hypothetical protein